MNDFNDFVKNGNSTFNSGNISDLIKNITSKYDGKSTKELISAIKKEAIERKKNHILSNDDLDKFKNTLSPFLDNQKKAYLNKIIDELKKI